MKNVSVYTRYMKFSIRLLYLYLFSFVGLLIAIIGATRLVDLGLKIFVFQDADQYTYRSPYPAYPGDPNLKITKEEWEQQQIVQQENQIQENKKQRQRTAAEALAMVIIGTPLYLYHWTTITRENK